MSTKTSPPIPANTGVEHSHPARESGGDRIQLPDAPEGHQSQEPPLQSQVGRNAGGADRLGGLDDRLRDAVLSVAAPTRVPCREIVDSDPPVTKVSVAAASETLIAQGMLGGAVGDQADRGRDHRRHCHEGKHELRPQRHRPADPSRLYPTPRTVLISAGHRPAPTPDAGS